MALDRERRPGHEAVAGREPVTTPPRPADGIADAGRADVSRATVFWYSAVGLVLFSWFLFGWLVLEQGFIDSVGEAAGAGFALLLAVSVVGTVRRSRAEGPARRR